VAVIRVYYNERDRFGHFVAPATAANRNCPHRCCRDRHPHPDKLPVKLDRQVLRGMGSDELERELEHYFHYRDTREGGALQIAAEIDRRSESARKADARKLRASQRRQAAESEYRDEVYRQWLAAENATNGYMLNREGKRRDIDERTLFTGPESRVAKYASPELVEFFEANPRPTRASWFGSARSRREHLSGRRIGLWPRHAPTAVTSPTTVR
jgi:hypothetical protein